MLMNENNTRRAHARREQSDFIKALIFGAIGLAVTFFAALLLPLAAMRAADPNSLVDPLAAGCLALGGFAAAFPAVFFTGSNPVSVCAVSGVPTAVAVLAATLISPRGEGLLPVVCNAGAFLLALCLGAFSAATIKRRRGRNIKRVVRRR